MKELSKEQQRALKKVIRQSFRANEKYQDAHQQRTSDNLMRWNKENLSPTGGKKSFGGLTHRERWNKRNEEDN